jgi:DNA-binding MarR family transcriptional regulator
MESSSLIFYQLQHLAAMVSRQSDQILLERLGIGMSQLRILNMLEQDPNTAQRKIANRLGQTEASISRQIKLMAGKGLLAVGVSPRSKREHVALLTAKGAKMTEAAKEVLEAYYQPAAGLLTDKQRKYLDETLEMLHSHTCVPGKPFACDSYRRTS